MGRPVVHFEVIAPDPDALRSFYEQMFDWKFSEPMGPTDYTVLERGQDEPGIGGGIGGVPEGYGGHVTIYVDVPDVEAALAQAESLGGRRMMGPDPAPGDITIGLFSDPQGHVVGLVSMSDTTS